MKAPAHIEMSVILVVVVLMAVVLLSTTILASMMTTGQNDELILPFTASDSVRLIDSRTLREETLTGRIEDIVGESVVLRKSGRGSTQIVRLKNVVELDFPRDPAYSRGLRQLNAGQYESAVESLQSASAIETRPWVWREINAALAQAAIGAGDRSLAIERIERIHEQDESTRHVALLPLVWDETLPDAERTTMAIEALQEGSLIQQLTAASVYLLSSEQQSEAIAALQRVRGSGQRQLAMLAETQLWRLKLSEPSKLTSTEVRIWMNRLRDFSHIQRSGPQSLVGRALQQQLSFDQAALQFLWTPLMSPIDPPLAAQAMRRAAECLDHSGRSSEANRVRLELSTRFPETSAARGLPQPAMAPM